MYLKKKWEEHQDDDEFLKDLLFESNLSLTQIAAELSFSIANLNKRIKQLGLSWIKQKNRKILKFSSINKIWLKKIKINKRV